MVCTPEMIELDDTGTFNGVLFAVSYLFFSSTHVYPVEVEA